jgi:HAD superfamily hydrolase (TIGR01509 family)
MRLYIVRHGETIWNIDSKFQGWTDNPLTAKGEEQASEIAELLRPVRFDAVYSSTLQRAIRTAEIIVQGRALEISQVHNFREMGLGVLEGMREPEIREQFPHVLEQWRREPADYVVPEGESLRQVQERCWPELEKILDRHNGQTVLLVAHHTVNKCLIGKVLHLPLAHFRNLRQPPCAVSVLEFLGERRLVHAVNVNWRDGASTWHDMPEEQRSRLKSTRAVIFDLDGVLLDSMHHYVTAWRSALAERGIFPPEIDFYRREGERGAQSVLYFYTQAGRSCDDSEVQAVVNRMISLYHSYPAPKANDSSFQLVSTLRNQGIKTGLVTGSAREDVERKLTPDQLTLFDTVITQYDVDNGKPHPQPYLTALEALGCSADEALAIENAPFGIRSARDAGLLTIAITSTLPVEELSEADLVIDNIDRFAGWLSL